MKNQIHKYPRTNHIEGSKLQQGDEDRRIVPIEELRGKHLVIEEKQDGSNSGISYDSDYTQLLQSRGHYLTGGPREKEFELFKQWASVHTSALLEALEDRYIMYGENMYAKHTVFYDNLSHYFMEFDIFDTVTGEFLSTPRRQKMLDGLPVTSVLVLFEGEIETIEDITKWVGPSYFKTPSWVDVLKEQCRKIGLDEETVICQTNMNDLMEGLYIKYEEDGVVKDRYKYVRGDFQQAIMDSDGHWHDRKIIPNVLNPEIDIYKQ